MALVTRRAGGEGDSGVKGVVVGAGGEDAAGKVNLAGRSLEQTNKMRISAKLVSAAATPLIPVSTH